MKLEDQQLELMEKAEFAQKEVTAADRALAEARKLSESQIGGLAEREKNLLDELAVLNPSEKFWAERWNRTPWLVRAAPASQRGERAGGNLARGLWRMPHAVAGAIGGFLPGPAKLVACRIRAQSSLLQPGHDLAVVD